MSSVVVSDTLRSGNAMGEIGFGGLELGGSWWE